MDKYGINLEAVKQIPNNLEEAMSTLTDAFYKKEIYKFAECGPVTYHLGLGMYLRNIWGLWHGSVLARWFNTLGIWHADDMSGIVLESLHRKLTNKPIDLAGQVKYYLDHWNNGNQSKELA